MAKVFEKIALSGSVISEGYTRTGLVDKDSLLSERSRLERQTVGERAKIKYRCPNCNSEFVTRKRYKVDDNWI